MKSVLLALIAVISIFATASLAVTGDHSLTFANGNGVKLNPQKVSEKQASDQEKEKNSNNAGDRKVSAKGGKKAMNSTGKNEVATLAGGCFWCLEAVFNDLRGVEKVVSGYSGGRVAKPTYEQVSTGNTGHAEVVQIAFDPQVISFKELLEVFFTIHDPTTRNRQGADVGPQYRSAIFYHSPEQKAVTDKVIADITAANIWNKPIVTEVAKFEAFYPAEGYHQRYYERNPNQAYCRMVIEPKVIKFRKQFFSKLKKQAAER
jgi:peptide-methionine (S)-S-oxide reductase